MLEVDEGLVRRLLVCQHPDLADQPVRFVSRGWDNAIFRLGNDHAVRLPVCEAAAELVVNEQRWLPELAARLPLPVPAPVRLGTPSDGYPWKWSVVPWLPGSVATDLPEPDQPAVAHDLADFVIALHRPAPPEAPENPHRGGPLRQRDALTRARLDRCRDHLGVEPETVERAWNRAVSVEPWSGPPVWIHGDLHPLNLLYAHGRLSAVIDFGDITAGDPATDLLAAWYLFEAEARSVLCDRLADASAERGDGAFDDGVWARGQGWAIAHALAVLDSDLTTEPLRRGALRALARVLSESGT